MKTSNKLLLGALLVILSGLTISIFIMNSTLRKNLIVGKGEITSKTISVEDYTNINIAGNYQITYMQDDNYTVIIKAEENIINNINIIAEDGTLKASSDYMIASENISLYITSPKIENIVLTAGSSFTSDFIKSEELKINANGGVTLSMKGDFEKLNLFMNSGSNINIEGNCEILTVLANAGSILRAKNLESSDVNLTASSGSTLEVTAINTLNVESTSGSSVYYYGNPELKNIITGSGGTFQRREKN